MADDESDDVPSDDNPHNKDFKTDSSDKEDMETSTSEDEDTEERNNYREAIKIAYEMRPQKS